MRTKEHSKVTTSHLKRGAYLYVRQSTYRQVFENTESTERQYALRDRAVALGWPAEKITVIDCDQGKSAASAVDRKGFQRLVADVGLGRVGIVLGLEVSRLARNSSDWHRLLEICGLTDTLILDEDGLYCPGDFNDRLLLGLKGAMSEAELHMLRARLRGGMLNKARRGELRIPLPVGFRYDSSDRVILDPDKRVQETVRLFFQTFRRTGTATATVKYFQKKKILFPRLPRARRNKSEALWGPLGHSRALQLLHNPRYAGAFCWGRTRQQKVLGTKRETLPLEEWEVFLPDFHEGYISWTVFEENEKRLLENAQAHGVDRRKSPPREGPALIQGLVICGVCGNRMTVRYHVRRGTQVPDYMCQREGIENGAPICQHIPGAKIDEAIGDLLVQSVTPAALEVALQVQHELQRRIEETDRLRRQHVERARYESDLAQRRFMQIDPDNRLVADTLEADWNQRLRTLSDAQEQYEKQREADSKTLGEEQRDRILALATDFPRLWRNPATPQRERKRLLRLLIEDVTLHKGEEIRLNVRFKGGKNQTFTLPRPKRVWESRQTHPDVIAEIDRLLDDHTDGEVAALLNECGMLSGVGKTFDGPSVQRHRRLYELRSRYDRLRAAGMLTVDEMAKRLQVHKTCIGTWRRQGLLRGIRYDDKNSCLFEPPGDDAPVKMQGTKFAERRVFPKVTSKRTKEVQYEA